MINKPFFIFLLTCLISVSSIAEEQKSEQRLKMAQAETQEAKTSEQQPQSSRKWISNGESLEKWWKKRVRKIGRRPEWLYHLEGKYSLSRGTGNYVTTDHEVKTALFLRKGLVSSKTSFYLHNIKEGKGRFISKKEKKVLEEFAYAELWKRVDLAGNLQWYTYNRRFIENRYSVYGGLYFTLLDVPEAYTLKLGAFYGYATISYMNDKIARREPELELEFPDYKSPLVYIQQRFNWSIGDNLSFTQKGKYRLYTENRDFVHWILNFELNYELTKHFSIYSSYEVDYESTELDQKVRGLEKRDTNLNLGIQISF